MKIYCTKNFEHENFPNYSILNLTVSVGTINGLIFYVNIIKIEEDYLFPHDHIQVPILFVSWINLDFGINTRFAPGLTGYSHDSTVPKSNSCSGSRRSNGNNGGSDKGLNVVILPCRW